MHDIHRKFPVILGIRLMEAVRLIREKGFSMRMARTDSKTNDLGDSFEPMRVNLSTSRGIVIGYTFF
jgi:hypothetical protein